MDHHTLYVFYDFQGVAHMAGADAEAEEAAGCPVRGSGTDGAVRDLEFHFPSEEGLEQARARLKDAGFRFFP